jgi:Skp family chaperone for outer membrane proteins
MTKTIQFAIGTAAAFALAATTAHAQAAKKPAVAPAATPAAANTGTVVRGIGILNVEAAIENTDAFRYAAQQQQTYFKAQIDFARARSTQLDTLRRPMYDKLNADIAAKKPEAALQQQALEIQKAEAQAKQDIEQSLEPLAASNAYVKEQIADQLDRAAQNAMKKMGVTLVIEPGSVVARHNAYEMTDDVIVELNLLLPANRVQVVPPQGWVPRQQREQQAAQQQAQQQPAATPAPAAPAGQPAPRPATPAGPQPDGR